ncbi:MAG: PDZ domain-containing protein [Saprospiraceae bacterium]|nr:PDZ domain-containing protein [Saprospiraceae bacterium]
MKIIQWITAAAVLACMITGPALMAQEERSEEKETTKVIIIEEKTDRYGNKTVTKTVKEGNFTDEEIEKMIEGDGERHSMWHGQEKLNKGMFKSHAPRGYLGVNIDDAEEGGALVREVVEGSPAADASLSEGDIITEVNGDAIASADALIEAIGSLEPGTTVALTYLRDGDTQTTEARLEGRNDFVEFEMSDDFEWDQAEFEKKMEKMHEKMKGMHEKMEKMHKEKEWKEGMHDDMEWNQAPRPRFGVYIEETEGGVVVTEVVEGSLAEGAGLQEGDIITAFNGTAVATPEALVDAVQSAEAGKKATVKYLRDGKAQKASVTFAKED